MISIIYSSIQHLSINTVISIVSDPNKRLLIGFILKPDKEVTSVICF